MPKANSHHNRPKLDGNPYKSKYSGEPYEADLKSIIFWDFENCSVPKGIRGHEVVRRIDDFVNMDLKCSLSSIHAIGATSALGKTTLDELKQEGVIFHEVPQNGKENLADIAIVAEVCAQILKP